VDVYGLQWWRNLRQMREMESFFPECMIRTSGINWKLQAASGKTRAPGDKMFFFNFLCMLLHRGSFRGRMEMEFRSY
jgi:hypothetical protein